MCKGEREGRQLNPQTSEACTCNRHACQKRRCAAKAKPQAQRVLVLLLDMNAKPHANASLSDKRHVARKRGTASLAECAVGNVH